MDFFKLLHPLLVPVMRGATGHIIHFLNEKPNFPGNAIYAFNHGAKYDTPCAGLAIGEQAWLLAGKQRLTLPDRAFFELNGCVWVDRKDKASKAAGAQKMLSLLRRGENLLMFPEGTWNTTPSLPMLPMAWGIIDLAAQSGCPIVPIALEYVGNDCCIRYGEPFYCTPQEDKLQKLNQFRDTMATLRWQIWQTLPPVRRADLTGREWSEEIAARIAAYPKLDYAYEQSCVRREKGVTPPEEAFAHLNCITPSLRSAFLFRKTR